MHPVDSGDLAARPAAPAPASGETRERFSVKVSPAAARPTPRFCKSAWGAGSGDTAAAPAQVAPEVEGSAPAWAPPVGIHACAILQRVQWGLYCSTVQKKRAIVSSACRPARMARTHPDSDAARASDGDTDDHRLQHDQRGDVPVLTFIASGTLAACLFPTTTPLSTSSPTRRLLHSWGFNHGTVCHAKLVTEFCELVLSLSLHTSWLPALCLLLLAMLFLNLMREWALSIPKIGSHQRSMNCLVLGVLALAVPNFGAVHGFKARSWQPISGNPWAVGSPTSLVNHTMVTGNGPFIYVFGGMNITTNSFSNQLLLLDANQSQWTPIKKCEVDPFCSAPTPRHSHAMVAVNDDLYMFGGRVSGESLPASSELWRLSTKTFEWTELPSRGCNTPGQIPFARYGHAMTLVDPDMLYVYGGWIYDEDGNVFEDNSDSTGSVIWGFNISAMCWERKTPCNVIGVIKSRACPSPEIAKAGMPGRTAIAMASVGQFVYMYGGCHHAHDRFKQDAACQIDNGQPACEGETQGALIDKRGEWMCTLYPGLEENPDSTQNGLYMYRYDTTNNAVSLLDETSGVQNTPSNIHVRYGHTMTAVGEKLFVFGGTVHQYDIDNPVIENCQFATTSSQCICGAGFTLYCGAYRYASGDGSQCKCYKCDPTKNTTLYRTRYSTTKVSSNTTFDADFNPVKASEDSQPVCRSELPIITSYPTDLWEFSTQSLIWRQMNQLGAGPGLTSVVWKSTVLGTDLYLISQEALFKFSTSNENWATLYNHTDLVAAVPQGAQPPLTRAHATAVVGSDLYRHGGQNASSMASDALWKFSGVSKSWMQLQPHEPHGRPSARYGHVMAAIVSAMASQLYLFGGRSLQGVANNEMWMLDIAPASTLTWTHISPIGSTLPTPRYFAAMTSVMSSSSEVLYMYGGMTAEVNVTGCKSSSELWEFEPREKKWTLHGNLSAATPRYGHALKAVGSKLYLFGGAGTAFQSSSPAQATSFACLDATQASSSTERTSAEMWTYDIRGSKHGWTLLVPESPESSPSRRAFHAMASDSTSEALFVHGGRVDSPDGSGQQSSAELWKFTIPLQQWQLLNPASQTAQQTPVRSLHTIDIIATPAGDPELILHGGATTASETEFTFTRKIVANFPSSSTELTRVYDGDIVKIASDTDWAWQADLCDGDGKFFPCSMIIVGTSSSSTIHRLQSSRLSCDALKGCTQIALLRLVVSCRERSQQQSCDSASAAFTAPESTGAPVEVSGRDAVLSVRVMTHTHIHTHIHTHENAFMHTCMYICLKKLAFKSYMCTCM